MRVHVAGPICYTWCDYRRGQSAQTLVLDWLTRELQPLPDVLGIYRDRHGRPHLMGIDNVDTNWSHSGSLLLVAWGHGVEVGADIEFLRPRANVLALAARFFAPDEAAQLQSLPAETQEDAFVRLWCAKEAVLKAAGCGIGYGLHRLVFTLDGEHWQLVQCADLLGQPGDWQLLAFSPRPGYRAALAWRERATSARLA